MTEPLPIQPPPEENPALPWLRLGVSAIVGAILLIGALVCVGVIYLTEPEAEREGAVKRTAMLVEVTEVEHGSFQPSLVALGEVVPNQDVRLEPRVSGQVVEIGDVFVPGRVVSTGDLLVRIDPADARNALAQRRSTLHQAEADLALERGRQAVARTERQYVDGTLSGEQEALVLREPQLKAAEATVASARAAVTQAELDVARTRVTAPFDAMVLDRDVALGSQVRPGEPLGRLVGVDRFWVELTLPVARLRYLDIAAGSGPEVVLRDRNAWPEGATRTGRLDSIVRQVDEKTRLARLLVTVDDPLGLDPATEGPALIAGSWVEARVQANELHDVVRLDRGLLRKGGTVWVKEGDQLRIRDVDIVMEDDRYAYIAAGLGPDDLVVTTNLSTVSDGAPLRTEAE